MVWYFIGVYIINRTLHGRLEIRNFSSTLEEKFRISARPCNIRFLFRYFQTFSFIYRKTDPSGRKVSNNNSFQALYLPWIPKLSTTKIYAYPTAALSWWIYLYYGLLKFCYKPKCHSHTSCPRISHNVATSMLMVKHWNKKNKILVRI